MVSVVSGMDVGHDDYLSLLLHGKMSEWVYIDRWQYDICP